MNAYAFAHSDLAGTITLPGNVDFDDYAFAYCDKLTSVDFSGTISRLGENLFMEDKALKRGAVWHLCTTTGTWTQRAEQPAIQRL